MRSGVERHGLDALGAQLQATERATIAAMAPTSSISARSARVPRSCTSGDGGAAPLGRPASGGARGRQSGDMPSLAVALTSAEELYEPETVLTDVHAFLSTGGEVGFGFATRPGP